MKKQRKNDWSDENIEFLKANANKGFNFLANHFNYSDGGIRSAAAKYKVKVMSAKNIIRSEIDGNKKEHQHKNAPFILLENTPCGGCKVWIPSEKIALTIPPGKDPQTAVDKIVFRHGTTLKFE